MQLPEGIRSRRWKETQRSKPPTTNELLTGGRRATEALGPERRAGLEAEIRLNERRESAKAAAWEARRKATAEAQQRTDDALWAAVQAR